MNVLKNLFFASVMLLSQLSIAQEAISTYYQFSEINTTYTDLIGGTNVFTSSTDDAVNANIPIGFNFIYGTQTKSSVNISVNGGISFNPYYIEYQNNIGNYNGSALFALWDDLYFYTGFGNSITYKTEGTSPNQTFTVEWKNVAWRSSGQNVSFQIVLSESSNDIQFNYGPKSSNDFMSASIGIASNEFSPNFISVTPGAPATASSSTANNNISSADYPNVNTSYLFQLNSNICHSISSSSFQNITNNSVDVLWSSSNVSPNADIEYGVAPYTFTGTPTLTNVASSPGNITGLSSGTSYDVYIRANCQTDGVSSWKGPYSFNTLCDPFDTPYYENFSSASVNCWSINNANSDNFSWELNETDNPLTGNSSAAINTRYTGGNNNDYLISPAINVANNQQLRFSYAVSSPSDPNEFEVLLSTTGIAPSDFNVILLPKIIINNENYVEQIISLSPYSGAIHVAFHYPNGSLNGQTLYIDQVVFEDVPVCNTPSNVITSNLAPTSVDLNWTENGSSTSYDIALNTPPFDFQGIPTQTRVSKPFTATGLSPETNYQFFVRANCDTTNNSSWEGPYTFKTPCGYLYSPFTEGFESFNSTNTFTEENCWTAGINGGYFWSLTNGSTPSTGTGPTSGNNGGKYVFSEASNGSFNEEIELTSPLIDISGTNRPNLSFYYHMYGAYMGKLEVEVFDGTNWIAVDEIIGQQQTRGSSSWILREIDLTGYTGIIQVKFKSIMGSSYESDIAIDDISISQLPPCVKPSNITTSNITANSADVSWVDPSNAINGDIEYGIAPFSPTGTPTNTAVSSSYTITGLNENTAYQYYIRANCDIDGYSAWSGPFNFTTMCSAFNVPFTEDFETNSTSENCWTVLNANNDNDSWELDFYTAYSGTQSAMISTNGNGGNNNDYLISPALNLTGNEQLRYYYRALSSNDPNDLEIKLSSTGISEANFNVTLMGVTNINNTIYQENIIDLSGYSGQHFIAFRVPPGGLDGWRLMLDLITIEPIPPCVMPSNIVASNETESSVDISWTGPGNASNFDIEYGVSPFTSTGIPSVSGVSSAYTITGLNANTNYQYYVRSNCGTDGYSTWDGPYSFTTLCGVLNIPFTEDFESSSTTKDCWTVLNENNDPDSWNLNSTNDAHTGSIHANIYTDNNNGNNDDYLITPTINLTGNEQLRFYYAATTSSEPNDFQVLLSTNGANPVSFTNTIMPLTVVNNTFYQEKIINLSAYTGNVNIAFHIPPGGLDGWNLQIDQVNIEALPACPQPYAVTTTNIDNNSAEISWSSSNATSWDIEYGTAPFSPTGTPTVSSITNPFTITGLNTSTNYQYYIRSNCNTDGYSSWTGPYSFKTTCNVINAPFTEDFETFDYYILHNVNSCWNVTNQSGYEWSVSTTGTTPSSSTGPDQANSGSRFLFTEASNGSFNSETELTTPLINLGNMTQAVLKFYYHMHGTYINELSVSISDGTNWTVIDNIVGEQNANQTDAWTEREIDISAYRGNIQIKFTGIRGSDFEGDIAIDDLSIYEVISTDLSLEQIQSATPSCNLSMEDVSIEIKNNGLVFQNGFDVGYRVNGSQINTEFVDIKLQPGQSHTYTFNQQADLSAVNDYSIDAWVNVSADQKTTNDTLYNWQTANLLASSVYNSGATIPDNDVDGVITSICLTDLDPDCDILSALVIDSLVHTYNGDLTLMLYAPNGDSLLISEKNGGSSDGFEYVTFTDSANQNISDVALIERNAFYQTEETAGLTKFSNINPNGSWKLKISDGADGDMGVIKSWHLKFENTETPITFDNTYKICGSSRLVLDGGNDNYYYNWSTGETTSSITIDSTTLALGEHTIVLTKTSKHNSSCSVSDSTIVSISTCTGIQNKESTKDVVTIYPNPTTGEFLLNIKSQNATNSHIKIVDLQGKIVFEDLINEGEFDAKVIDISNLNAGVYFALITTKNNIYKKQIIKH